jgi:hypothetical protein
MSDIARHFSQNAVLHLSCSNRDIFYYIYLNVFGIFRLPNKEHKMTFCCKNLKKKEKYTEITETLKNRTVTENSLPNSNNLKDLTAICFSFTRNLVYFRRLTLLKCMIAAV